MKTEIIAVGTELLLGQIVNTNASFISERLARVGYEVYYQGVVGDNDSRLREALDIAHSRSELVILCGGLGPTEDDLTKETVADFIGSTLATDQEALDKLEARIKVTNRVLTPNNLKQAQYIAGGEIIPNDRGLAIGSLVDFEGVKYLLLPGPPSELHWMVDHYVIPRLLEFLPTSSQLTSRVLRFYGIGESALATKLSGLIDQQVNPTIALYAKDNEVTIRLTAKGESSEGNDQLIQETENQVLSLVGDFFYGYGEDNNLIRECLKTIEHGSDSLSNVSIHDYFSQGRIALEWQREARSDLNVQGFNGRVIDNMLTTMTGEKIKLPDLSEEIMISLHQQLPENPQTDLSFFIAGQVTKSASGSFYEGESYLSIRLGESYHTKKTVYAGNEDTIRDRSVLETAAFVRDIIKRK